MRTEELSGHLRSPLLGHAGLLIDPRRLPPQLLCIMYTRTGTKATADRSHERYHPPTRGYTLGRAAGQGIAPDHPKLNEQIAAVRQHDVDRLLVELVQNESVADVFAFEQVVGIRRREFRLPQFEREHVSGEMVEPRVVLELEPPPRISAFLGGVIENCLGDLEAAPPLMRGKAV